MAAAHLSLSAIYDVLATILVDRSLIAAIIDLGRRRGRDFPIWSTLASIPLGRIAIYEAENVGSGTGPEVKNRKKTPSITSGWSGGSLCDDITNASARGFFLIKELYNMSKEKDPLSQTAA
jgi:hypothetical protein